MQLSSPAFENGQKIPKKYGYNHGNFNPPLIIQDVPKNSSSLLLIMDDPDAMKAVGKIWLHWILWNIPVDTKLINEDCVPENSIQGKNDFGEIGYGGPAPPDKEHTYIFRLFALNSTLEKINDYSIKEIEELIKNKILDEAVLKGKYSPQ